MKYLTIGAIALLAFAVIDALTFEGNEHERAKGTIIGIACMAAIAFVGRWQEWRDLRKVEKQFHGMNKGRPLLFALLLFAGQTARALGLLIAAIIGVGLILWGGIKLWSAALSIHPRLQPPQHVRVTVSKPVDVAIAAAPADVASEPATVLLPDVYMPGHGVPWLVMPHGFFASGGRIEWSSNAVDWVSVEQADHESQQGFWRARE